MVSSLHRCRRKPLSTLLRVTFLHLFLCSFSAVRQETLASKQPKCSWFELFNSFNTEWAWVTVPAFSENIYREKEEAESRSSSLLVCWEPEKEQIGCFRASRTSWPGDFNTREWRWGRSSQLFSGVLIYRNLYICIMSWRPEGVGFPRTGVICSSELPDVGTRNWTWDPQKSSEGS